MVSLVLVIFAATYPLLACSKASGFEGVYAHWLAPTLSFVVALVNFYSYTLFTIYLILLALSACWQGASRYNYYMVDAYETKMANALSPPPTI